MKEAGKLLKLVNPSRVSIFAACLKLSLTKQQQNAIDEKDHQ
jgi:hypothetical protein